ncbi:MAG: ribosome silencing factor [Actinobacteria bacterium]|nr:ribosome silencing factor [Actinomycetota bacterium]MCL6095377.1 ribosome silencing factor [Actinomycetota bacterium]
MTDRFHESLHDIPELAEVAATAAVAKGGERTVIMEVGELLGITDAFVITSGRNSRHVRTIVEHIERTLKVSNGTPPLQVEGDDDYRWVLLDYGDFLVHVFLEETRDYYDLERLWGDAPCILWEDTLARSARG